MIEQALLVDIWEAPQEVRNSFMDSVELNGNPFYHRWRLDDISTWEDYQSIERKIKVNDWLKAQGISKEKVIIITGGW